MVEQPLKLAANKGGFMYMGRILVPGGVLFDFTVVVLPFVFWLNIRFIVIPQKYYSILSSLLLGADGTLYISYLCL